MSKELYWEHITHRAQGGFRGILTTHRVVAHRPGKRDRIVAQGLTRQDAALIAAAPDTKRERDELLNTVQAVRQYLNDLPASFHVSTVLNELTQILANPKGTP